MHKDEDIIIHPRRGRKESLLPSRGLFFATPREAESAINLVIEKGGKRRFLYHSGLAVACEDQCFVSGPAIGAPIAAMTMEKLVVLGARKIILFGWCGAIDPGLQVGDVLVGCKPISGEGTSRYYQCAKEILPSVRLVSGLRKGLEEAGIAYKEGNVWSTDAPYREDRKQISSLFETHRVKAVDMEYSALCAVAAFRDVEFAGLFLVSDELYKKEWRPGFNRRFFLEKSDSLVQLLTSINF